ncbi:hypothetical protein ACF0H5_009641 [Mactra antiquata]
MPGSKERREPMSRAEIQKRYREKKKRESGSYMKKERERKRMAYIPTTLLSEPEAKKRRTETLKRVIDYINVLTVWSSKKALKFRVTSRIEV